jgi:DNA-binding CsgD family transcriptional regulator
VRKGQPRRWAIYPYTDRELAVVALRVEGIRPEEIASRLMLSPGTVYHRLSAVYRKAGLSGVSELREWAMRFGLDAPLPKERPEDMPERPEGRTKTRIRMRRMWRATD